MMNIPLLSICIPTYNRSGYLVQTLDSFIKSKGFDSRVEIVISDNCSTDDTENICREYADKYDNIKYYRQPKPTDIADKNFADALSLGTGIYLKLSNDTLPFKFDTLEFMLDKITQNINNKIPLFFHPLYNTHHIKETAVEVNSVEELVANISYGITWIAGFGCWREQFSCLEDKYKNIGLQLMQTDWTLRLFLKHKKSVIFFRDMYEPADIEKKCSYNMFEIFGQNYLSIYKEYIRQGLLARNVYDDEKKRLLYRFFLRSLSYSILNKSYSFKVNKMFYYLRDYKYDWYFYVAFAVFPFVLILEFIKNILRKYCPVFFNKIKEYKK